MVPPPFSPATRRPRSPLSLHINVSPQDDPSSPSFNRGPRYDTSPMPTYRPGQFSPPTSNFGAPQLSRVHGPSYPDYRFRSVPTHPLSQFYMSPPDNSVNLVIDYGSQNHKEVYARASAVQRNPALFPPGLFPIGDRGYLRDVKQEQITFNGHRQTPSAILFGPRQEMWWGELARKAIANDPSLHDRIIPSLKLAMLSAGRLSHLRISKVELDMLALGKRYLAKISEMTTQTLPTITRMLLAGFIENARSEIAKNVPPKQGQKVPIWKLIICVPEIAGDDYKNLWRNAARENGISNVELVSEIEGAVAHLRLNSDLFYTLHEGDAALVIDGGGSTVDWGFILMKGYRRSRRPKVRIVASGSVLSGGQYITERLRDHILGVDGEKLQSISQATGLSIVEIKIQCEERLLEIQSHFRNAGQREPFKGRFGIAVPYNFSVGAEQVGEALRESAMAVISDLGSSQRCGRFQTFDNVKQVKLVGGLCRFGDWCSIFGQLLSDELGCEADIRNVTSNNDHDLFCAVRGAQLKECVYFNKKPEWALGTESDSEPEPPMQAEGDYTDSSSDAEEKEDDEEESDEDEPPRKRQRQVEQNRQPSRQYQQAPRKFVLTDRTLARGNQRPVRRW